ncbi:MAG: glycerol-3-phosphate dehydrogenase [Clostridiales bacterium]|jgi:glycerol-3-phosphate dehydrogenase (NAD(P)+)|nr:glycerol-3-phosphate dehydrogenase [Clostridiales bacterium]
MKICVLGCGRWGSFLAWYCNYIGASTFLWGRAGSKNIEVFNNSASEQYSGINSYVALPKAICITTDFEQATKDCNLVLISIPSQKLREFLNSQVVKTIQDKIVVLCMKGIELQTGKRLTQVAIECGLNKDRLAVWAGPGHIQDFVRYLPNCMLIDSYSQSLTQKLADMLVSKVVRFYYGQDIIGTEFGAATKNIIGIIAGMLDGRDMSCLKGPLMSRGAREIGRLIDTVGGSHMSAYGLCHLGDYETTLFSHHSNNRKWGELFAKGEVYSKLAEGVATAQAVSNLGKKLNIDLPLTYALNDALDNKITPIEMLQQLFERPIKCEF